MYIDAVQGEKLRRFVWRSSEVYVPRCIHRWLSGRRFRLMLRAEYALMRVIDAATVRVTSNTFMPQWRSITLSHWLTVVPTLRRIYGWLARFVMGTSMIGIQLSTRKQAKLFLYSILVLSNGLNTLRGLKMD